MAFKLYLIPGTQCNEKIWAAMRPYMPEDVQLLHLDIPQGMSFDEITSYYHHLIKEKRINLVGFSLGGYIASYFASKYPERLNKLFVIANSPTSLSDIEIYQRNENIRLIQAHGYKGMSRKRIAMMLDPSHHSEEYIRPIMEMDEALGGEHLLSQYQHTTERQDLANAIKDLPCDTSFYYSEQDSLVNVQWLRSLYQQSTKITLLSTAGCGHMLPLEKPQELAEHLIQWIEK